MRTHIYKYIYISLLCTHSIDVNSSTDPWRPDIIKNYAYINANDGNKLPLLLHSLKSST